MNITIDKETHPRNVNEIRAAREKIAPHLEHLEGVLRKPGMVRTWLRSVEQPLRKHIRNLTAYERCNGQIDGLLFAQGNKDVLSLVVDDEIPRKEDLRPESLSDETIVHPPTSESIQAAIKTLSSQRRRFDKVIHASGMTTNTPADIDPRTPQRELDTIRGKAYLQGVNEGLGFALGEDNRITAMVERDNTIRRR